MIPAVIDAYMKKANASQSPDPTKCPQATVQMLAMAAASATSRTPGAFSQPRGPVLPDSPGERLTSTTPANATASSASRLACSDSPKTTIDSAAARPEYEEKIGFKTDTCPLPKPR